MLSRITSHDKVDDDLRSLITEPITQQTEVFSEALRLLTSLQSSASCTRLAASGLIRSCQSLTGPVNDEDQRLPDSDSTLDDIKSVYAARLAVCELVGAGTTIPPSCTPLMPASTAKSKRPSWAFSKKKSLANPDMDMRRDDMGGKQLETCLKALESRPQWWTSYSNNRQNAVVMCQAARVSIEKGKRRRSPHAVQSLHPLIASRRNP